MTDTTIIDRIKHHAAHIDITIGCGESGDPEHAVVMREAANRIAVLEAERVTATYTALRDPDRIADVYYPLVLAFNATHVHHAGLVRRERIGQDMLALPVEEYQRLFDMEQEVCRHLPAAEIEEKLRRADLAMAEMARTIERLVGVDKGGVIEPETLVTRIRAHVEGDASVGPRALALLQEAARELEGKDAQIAALGEANASLATDAGLWAKEPAVFASRDGQVEFYAVGEDGQCSRMRFKLESYGASEAGCDFTLWENGAIHDGHDSIEEVANVHPMVAATLDDWKHDRLVPFEQVLAEARRLYLAE